MSRIAYTHARNDNSERAALLGHCNKLQLKHFESSKQILFTFYSISIFIYTF